MDFLYSSKTFVPEYPLKEAQVCFLGVPFDSTAIVESNQRFAPQIIRAALRHSVNWYLPQTKKKVNPKIFDAGDVDVVPGSFEKTDLRVRDTIRSILKENPKALLVTLGGEHSASLSVVRELKPKTIVNIDAHSDLWKEYQGEKYSHATWLYHAWKELGCNVVLLGTRTWDEEHEKTFKEVGVKRTLAKLKGPIYLSVDVDVFDPAFAPETGIPEPNGLTPEHVWELIDKVFKAGKVMGFDLMEVSSKQMNSQTANLAARTIVRALSNL